MPPVRHLISAFALIVFVICHLFADFARLATLLCRSHGALAAENLFLRKQLALFQERKAKPHRATDATRFLMALLGRFCNWRSALVVVKPDTLIRWHRKGFHFFWRWKSRPRGRHKLPANPQELIREMAAANPIWGQARIADELLLKLGIRVAPRTVGKYLTDGFRPGRTPDPKQRWMTFLRNHAKAIVACDFSVVLTARFRVLYVFVLMEVGTRRIVHQNVTAHPTAEWTLQQFREALPGDHAYRFVIHDRDRIYSKDLDRAVEAVGVRVLRTPVRAPKGNSLCERIVRTARRECLDFIIPFSEKHLKRTLLERVAHYNHGRPHKSLGPGIPVPLHPPPAPSEPRHQIPDDCRVRAKPVLGGLHHEYSLEKLAA
jgi:transposase InsO family protein